MHSDGWLASKPLIVGGVYCVRLATGVASVPISARTTTTNIDPLRTLLSSGLNWGLVRVNIRDRRTLYRSAKRGMTCAAGCRCERQRSGTTCSLPCSSTGCKCCIEAAFDPSRRIYLLTRPPCSLPTAGASSIEGSQSEISKKRQRRGWNGSPVKAKVSADQRAEFPRIDSHRIGGHMTIGAP